MAGPDGRSARANYQTFGRNDADSNEVRQDLEASSLEHADRTRRNLSKQRTLVLIGCSILQLPIWGFAVTYGIFEEHYLSHWTLSGSRDTVGVVGTTTNGVMYLSMPVLFAALSRRWAHLRRTTAFCGVVLACLGFFTSSWSTAAGHLVLTQGTLAALGCALVYTPSTLALSEYFSTNNRAIAYGVVLSCKNITGSACPFLMRYLLDRYGFRDTMRIWTAIVAGSSFLAVFAMPVRPPTTVSSEPYRSRKISWDFLHHRTFYIHSIAIVLQSSGYGLPQTYLNTYAHSIASFSASSSTLLVTLFNAPGIVSCAFFGLLSDNKRMPLSANSTTFISAAVSALAVFLLWGLAGASSGNAALLVLFALIYGCFAGGYSACWGGVIKEMEQDAVERNEAVDSGIVYGLLNGARGIGYIGGGLAGVQLLKAGSGNFHGKFGYDTPYAPLILYTGLATAFGGWSVLFKSKSFCRSLLKRI